MPATYRGDRMSSQQRDGNGWMVLCIASALFAFAKYIILGLLVALAVLCACLATHKFNEIRQQKLTAQKELRWRAEDQHMSYLRGEPYGVYGSYPPERL